MYRSTIVLASFFALAVASACTSSLDESSAASAYAVSIDDDGSTPPPPPPAVGLNSRVDPWSLEELAKRNHTPNIIVGPNGLRNPTCEGDQGLTLAQSDVTAKYVRGDTGKVCTGVLITQDDKMLVPLSCRSNVKGKLGKVFFDAYPSGCNIDSPPATQVDEYPVLQEALRTDQNFMVVQLGGRAIDGTFPSQNHFSLRWNNNKGAFTEQTNTTDELIGTGMNNSAILSDSDCRVLDVGSGQHSCDTQPAPSGPEIAIGSIVVYDFNACVVGAGGCAPGTGPQSPGSFPGRIVGFHSGPDGQGNNRLIYAAQISCPTCVAGPFLTPGDFTP